MQLKKVAIIGVVLLVVLGCVLAAGCTSTTPQQQLIPATEDISVSCGIYENDQYKTITLDITAEEFENQGFKPGDSVDITFSNGVEIKSVPYVTGFFIKSGETILLNRSKVYNTIEIAIVGAGNEWTTYKVTPNETVTIKLAERQKYADKQVLNTLKYGKDKTKFKDEYEFTNFRAISGGNLKENYIYRGASAIDNTGGRVEEVNKLLEKHEIKTLVDLADTEEKILKYQAKEGHSAPYFDKLYASGNVIAAGMSTALGNDDSKKKVVAVCKEMINHDGPFYLFCLEGKNRTGFLAMLLEALSGATYQEMKDDFMQTFTNYYHIEKSSPTFEKIAEIRFDETLKFFAENKKDFDFKNAAKNYLLSGGMTEEEINALIAKISK